MNSQDLFVIFPYLKTTSPVYVRGIQFRSNDDLDGLSLEQQNHLKTLFSMFFLRNNLRITHMVYAHIELSANPRIIKADIQRLNEAQTLINYLYATYPTPNDPTGDPFLYLEHTNMYAFTPENINTLLIWPEVSEIDVGTENLAEDRPTSSYIDGYEGILNGVSHFWVIAGNRIYPPIPHFSLNFIQDLSNDWNDFSSQPQNWAVVDLLRMGNESGNEQVEERIFTALKWYNRSTVQNITDDIAIVHLAIAFESLLNLEQDEGLSKRFKETVLILLGFVPRLDSWLEQFYRARSQVVHEGRLLHPMFFAADSKQLSNILRGKETGIQYRSLTTYGRRIFRLCLNAIVFGSRIAEHAGLSSVFIHNQERLEKICKQLNQPKNSPEIRLLSISKDVFDLQEYAWESAEALHLETLLGAGKLILQTYLETKPQLSQELEMLIQTIIQQLTQKDISEDEKLLQFGKLSHHLIVWHGSKSSNLRAEQLHKIVSSFLNYAASPMAHVRNIRQFQKQDKKSE